MVFYRIVCRAMRVNALRILSRIGRAFIVSRRGCEAFATALSFDATEKVECAEEIPFPRASEHTAEACEALLRSSVSRLSSPFPVTRKNMIRKGKKDLMANIKSQKKRIITNEKARLRNRAVKSELKTATRRVKDAVEAGNGAEAYAAALAASRLMDKAASKGVIHKKQAANRKSGIMALANTVATEADRAAYKKAEPKKQEKTGNKRDAARTERKAAMEAASKEKAKRREKQLKEEAAANKRKEKEAAEAAKAEAEAAAAAEAEAAESEEAAEEAPAEDAAE